MAIQSNQSIQYLEVNNNKKFNYFLIIQWIYKHWKLLIFTIIIGVCIAFVYNKFSVPIYQVSTTILFRSQGEELTGTPEVLPNLGVFVADRNFHNEVTVINSYPIILQALSNLNFEVAYFVRDKITENELYQTSPFVVVFNPGQPQPVDLKFHLTILNNNEYSIKAQGKNISLYSFSEGKIIQINNRIKISKTAKFGEEIASENYRFKIIPNSNLDADEYKKYKYSFNINNLHSLANYYKSALNISLYSDQSTVATINLLCSNISKDIDFLNSLLIEYIKENLSKKNHMAKATIDYINRQLQQIADSLTFAEEKLQDFRTRHQVIDVNVKAEQIYSQMQNFQSERTQLSIRQKYYLYIKEHFDKNKDISDLIAPSSMGIEDPLLGNLVQNFIELNSEKNTLLENNQQRSPYLRQLEIKIENLRNTIYENIKYHLNTVDFSLQDVEQRISNLNVELNKLPETERKLLGIERDFNLNDAIYTFLLQRRAEAQIALASNLPNTEIIEPPRIVGNGPILPRKKINYLLGILLGFLLPSSIIILRELYRNMINSKEEIAQITNLPSLGFILYKPRSKKNNIVLENPELPITDSFRKVLANLHYFSKGATQQVILITSSISGEGKSFCAYNLASVMALNGKKTILLAYDMRKPEFYHDLKYNTNQGISSVLANQVTLTDVIEKTKNENLHVIPPGPIPPNPSELISSPDTIKLIENIKESYEMIVIDTPPIGILADPIHLLNLADIKIFVVRMNFTPKNIFTNTINDLENKKIKNLTLLINDYKHEDSRYKYQYNYYSSKKKKKSIFSK